MKTIFAVVLSVSIIPIALTAQIRASEVGTMSQVIDGTVITVEYSRPRLRGRTEIFGTKYARWGETWTPGANWATTLDVSKPVKINGNPVAKGKYSVWMKLADGGTWTFILDPKSHRYHMEPPDSSSAQLRIPVKVEKAPLADVLTWSMPELGMDDGTLEMRWENVRVPLHVEVEPSLVMTFPEDEAQPYLGEYKWVEKDSAGVEKVMSFTVSHENNTLKGRWTPDDPYMKKFALVRIGDEMFAPAVYDSNGKIYEVLKPDLVVEFKREGGKVVSFTIRDMEDRLWGTGTRK
jgi:hypothetical protein